MSVIIRLQNLPWSANALDIRQYFHGLGIPEGGVHIVGGELGDAFIAFSTDEDARQAFDRNMGKIKEVQIKLMLSSRTEMQRVIESARTQSLAAFMPPVQSQPIVPLPAIVPAIVPPVPAVPSIVPNVIAKKEEKHVDSDKDYKNRDKKRSRSRSRDRTERSRDRDRRDRRRRDRSRSRSRDRRDRRRRDRSYSRERHRSRDRDSKTSRDRRRSDDKPASTSPNVNVKPQKPITSPWEQPKQHIDLASSSKPMNFQTKMTIDLTRRSLNTPTPPMIGGDRNNFPPNENSRSRDSWPPSNLSRHEDSNNGNSFINRPERNQSSNSSENFTNFRPGNNGPFNNFNENQNGRFGNNKSWMSRHEGSRHDGPNNQFNPRHGSFRDREREGESGCCVKLQPFYGGFGEIRRFFQGLFIHNSGIKLLNDRTGKRTGVTYVRFAFPNVKEEALTRSGQLLRHQTVEIMHLDDEEFENGVDRYRPPETEEMEQEESEDQPNFRPRVNRFSNPKLTEQPLEVVNFTTLLIEELPTYIKEQDILRMFSDFSLMSILIVGKQRKNLVAYVKFSNPNDAKKALEETARHTLDNKLLVVKPCSDKDFELVNREQMGEILDDEPPESNEFVKVESECISLMGLPLSINDRDITDFFCDVGIMPEKIHLINNSMGFTGQAFCEFANLDEAKAAMSKDGMYLGSNVITVKSITRDELGNTVRPSAPRPLIQNNEMMHQNPHPPMNNGPGPGPRPFFRNNNFGPRGPPNFMMPPRHMMRFPGPPHHMHNDVGSPPGCTVLMENVPYKAGLEEILEFFCDFDVPSDNVLRRFNNNGQPSGETKVIFKDPDAAHKAIQTKNREKIRDRVIYLSIC